MVGDWGARVLTLSLLNLRGPGASAALVKGTIFDETIFDETIFDVTIFDVTIFEKFRLLIKGACGIRTQYLPS